MARKPPSGPHAEVAERFAFLLDATGLDREGFAAAVDGAVTPRSLFAVLAGDRRPSRALAVLVERTFGFRADHLLSGEGPMWVRPVEPDALDDVMTDVERRLVAFGRRSVDNARVLAGELERAEAWERMWVRAQALLADLEQVARDQDPSAYPAAAAATLQACWAMADAFSAWTDAQDRRRVVRLTRLFAHRFLVQVPAELQRRGALDEADARRLREHATTLLDDLARDGEDLAERVRDASARIDALTAADDRGSDLTGLAGELDALLTRLRSTRPAPR